MISFPDSRSGLPTAIVNDKRIHSGYDPKREAERFVEAQIDGCPDTIIVLGPGLGYLYEALTEHYPKSRIILIFYSSLFFERFKKKHALCWHPESDDSLFQFLNHHISELDLEGLHILEWPPSAESFPDRSRQANTVISQLVRERNGSIVTSSAYGKRWIKNALYNFLFCNDYRYLTPGTKPICIVASGPSLNKSLPALKQMRDSYQLWSLPSSLAALKSYDIKPDLVVFTDPGFYNRLHFYPFTGDTSLPVLMPYSASRGLQKEDYPVILISQAYIFEDAFVQHLPFSPFSVPANGTVAGTALEIALRYTNLPIFFAGLDFCYVDIKGHVKPHSFDPIFFSHAGRTNPILTQRYARTRSQLETNTPGSNRDTLFKAPLAHMTYAGWFSNRLSGTERDIYRLDPSPVPIEGMITIENSELERTLTEYHTRNKPAQPGSCNSDRISDVPSYEKRCNIAQHTLTSWRKQIQECSSAISRSRSITPLMTAGTVLTLLFYSNIAGLMEIRRKNRQEGNSAAFRTAKKAMEETDHFFKNLLDTVGAL